MNRHPKHYRHFTSPSRPGYDDPAPSNHPAGLEPVFSPGHPYHTRLYYDPKEGSYYDRATDLYLTLTDATQAFGLPH